MSFNICCTMLTLYESVVVSVILYAVACWDSGLRVTDTNGLSNFIREASDVEVSKKRNQFKLR